MARDEAGRLSLAEAYHAAQTFLTHIEFIPDRVDEPVDGVIELEGSDFLARVKFERDQVGQGALIALIKAASENNKARLLFSATGFSGSVREMAETHAIALLEIGPDGAMVPCSTSARSLMSSNAYVAPFADPTVVSFPEEEQTNPFAKDLAPIADEDWLECPSCGTTHHPEANFCATCGGSVIARGELGTRANVGKAAGDRALPTNPAATTVSAPPEPAPPLPQAQPPAEAPPSAPPTRGAQLRCRTCGSHDIDLISL